MRFEDLSDDEKAWAVEHEALWRRAHEIALSRPELDVSLLYHTLVNFRRSPEERLARGLSGGDSRAARGPQPRER